MSRVSSTIWPASSRVGARMSALGRGPPGLTRSTIGTANASVLPDPVGDLARTSRPARTSEMTSRWMANGTVMPRSARAPHTARDTPRSAKDCWDKVLLLAATGPRTIREATATSESHVKRARESCLAADTVSDRETSVAANRSCSGLARRRPGRARVGQRREDRLDLRAARLELGRQDHLGAEIVERHVDREAGAVVGDLEEHAAGLAEVDRVEVVAVDDRRGVHAGLADPLVPLRVLRDRRAERDVVDGAGPLQAALVGRGLEEIAAAAALAAQLPSVVARGGGAEQGLEQSAGLLGVEAVGAHGVEATQRVL